MTHQFEYDIAVALATRFKQLRSSPEKNLAIFCFVQNSCLAKYIALDPFGKWLLDLTDS